MRHLDHGSDETCALCDEEAKKRHPVSGTNMFRNQELVRETEKVRVTRIPGTNIQIVTRKP